MAYTRTNWVEEETPLSAQNFNNIEDGIEELQAQKVDKVSGKGLSDQNYTAAEKTKLAGIEAGAEVNVQPDWNQSDTSADDYIKNKPANATTSSDGFMSAADKTKLNGIEAGAQVNPGVATTSANGLMSSADKLKLDKVKILIATATTQASVSIAYRETKTVQFKYKTSRDYFTRSNIVVPIDIPEFSNGLDINGYDHETGYFNIRLTNNNPTTRVVSSGKNIKLLVIDNEVS